MRKKTIWKLFFMCVAWFFLCWALSCLWLVLRSMFHGQPLFLVELKYILVTLAAQFFIELSRFFDDRDDRRGGESPEVKPWPQSPDTIEREVLMLDLDSCLTKK